MRIGHYMEGIWDGGGVASYIRRISAAQQQAGHEVVYLDPACRRDSSGSGAVSVEYVRDDAHLLARAAQLRLDILHLHAAIDPCVHAEIPIIRSLHNHTAYCPGGSKYLRRSSRPCPRAYGLAGCLWGHVVDHCGSVRPGRLLTDFRATWREMRLLKSVTTLTNSHFLKQEMVRSGYRADSIFVLPLPAPGAPAYVPPPCEGVPRFVFAGRIVPEKGLEWLLRALREAKGPVHLDVLGQGHCEPACRRLAQQLQVSDRVTFHGWCGEPRVHEALIGARALIIPSVWHEPAGLVILEAAANGRAVIASRVGGIPEYALDGKSALLVDPHDTAAMARAIERLAGDWQLARQLGEEGRRMARASFSLRQHSARLIRFYEQCGREATYAH